MVAFSSAGGTRPLPPEHEGIPPAEMAGGQHRFADTWGPSALRLGFFFGTDPSPELPGSAPPVRSPEGLPSRAQPFPTSEDDEEDEDEDDEQYYVTLDYSYLPPSSPGVSLVAPPPYPAPLPTVPAPYPAPPPTAPVLQTQTIPWSWTRGSGHFHGEDGRHFERTRSLPDLAEEDRGEGTRVASHQAVHQGVQQVQEGEGGSVMGSGVSLVGSNYSDDEDGDEFGFLSSGLTPASTVAAMQKAKSPSPSHRILSRVWLTRNKPQPGTPTPLWSPEGSSAWCSVSGRRVVLRPVSLLGLSEVERLALQRVALAKLQSLDLGCTVAMPRESTGVRRSKRKMLSLKRRAKSANLTASLDEVDKPRDGEAAKVTDSRPRRLVFGIPLAECIANDLDPERRGRNTRSYDVTQEPTASRRSSSSSQSSDDIEQNGSINSSHNGRGQRTAASESVSDSESSSLVDLLSLSLSRDSSRHASLRSRAPATIPLVPFVVQACFQHIQNYGLHTVGIFRVGASKKRTKQLRDAFNSGCDVILDASHHPHDVAHVLKEYFRELPEPLLTRDLYQPFVSTSRMPDVEQQLRVLRYLVCLLPPANCHTLAALLSFLAVVAKHAADCVDSQGDKIEGNRMDSHNLATLFGPNLLHRTRAMGERQYQVDSTELAQQSKDVIQVIKVMIDNHDRLLKLPPSVRDEGLQELYHSDPQASDKILRHLVQSEEEGMTSEERGLRHTPSSEADLQAQSRRLALTHPPVRRGQSADPYYPGGNRGSHGPPGSSVPVTDQTWPPPRLTVTSAGDPQEVMRRWRGEDRGERGDLTHRRPYSESLVQGLSPLSLLPHSQSSGSSGLSSAPSPPASPDAPSHRLTSGSYKARSVSPAPPSHRPDPSRVGSAEWQREKWKHWEMIAAERSNTEDSAEQETLV